MIWSGAIGQLKSQRGGHGLFKQTTAEGNKLHPQETLIRTYGWNQFFEPTSIKDNRWGETAYQYDARGQVTASSFGDGFGEKFQYDPAQNISAVAGPDHHTERGASVEGPVYTARVTDYRSRQNASSGQTDRFLNWQASKGGRVEIARGTNGERIALEYDQRGRVTKRLVSRNGFRLQVWTFEWDARDRLAATNTPDGDRWTYAYDPLGRRINKRKLTRNLTADGQIGSWKEQQRVDFVWDGDVLAFEEEVNDKRFWHFEPDSFVPVARHSGSILDYIVCDHLGTPREIFSEDGKLKWAAEYSTWGTVRRLWQADNDNEIGPSGPFQGYDGDGNPVYTTRIAGRGDVAVQGALALKSSEAPNPNYCPIRFQGQWADEETGLHYNRFRYYDPEASQYLSPDPVGMAGGFRKNGFVNFPTTWIDPFGLAPFKDGVDLVAPDWFSKGMHGMWNGVELKVKPNHLGGLTFKPVFSKDAKPNRRKCLEQAKRDAERWFSDPKNRESALSKLEGGKQYYDQRGAGREWAELRRILSRE